MRTRHTGRLLAALVISAAAFPAAAHADSLVYLKGGHVWVANPLDAFSRPDEPAGKRHLLEVKSSQRTRRLSGNVELGHSETRKVNKLLGR